MYGITSSTYNDIFTSSLPVWIPFISFLYLIAVARTFKTMLNRKGEKSCSRFRTLSASHCWVLYWLWVCHKWLFIMLRYIPFLPTLVRLFVLWILNFVKCFFLPLLRWSCIFVFSFVYVVIDWFCICWTILVNFGWIPFGCGAWSFLSVVGFSLLIFCSEFLYLHSSKILVYNFLFWLYLCLVLVSGW